MKNSFTEDQVRQLQANQYTEYVSSKSIRFTDAFKHLFWDRYVDGARPVDIFIECGYDPEVIGQSRISNTAYLISKSKGEQAQLKTVTREYQEVLKKLEVVQYEIDTLKKIIILANTKK
jgi:hypothetical protein